LACVSPRLIGLDGIEQPAGGRWLPDAGRTEFLSSSDLSIPVGRNGYWAVGTAPLFRASAFYEAKGFDEGFFAYGEEVDLCLRLGNLGYRFRAVPEATVVHFGQGSSGGNSTGGSPFADYLGVRNLFRQVWKHPPRTRRFQLLLRMAARTLDAAGCYWLHGQTAKARATVQGLFAVLVCEYGKPRCYGRANQLAEWVCRHPWSLARLFKRMAG